MKITHSVIKWFGCQPKIYSTSEDEEAIKYQGNDVDKRKKSEGNPAVMNNHLKDGSPNEKNMKRQKDNHLRKMMRKSNANKNSSVLVVQDLESTNET